MTSPLFEQARPLLTSFVEETKTNFLSRFGHWVEDASRLESILTDYGNAQISLILETDAARLQDLEEIKESVLRRLDLLGLELQIIGKTDAKQFFRDEITAALGYVPMIAGLAVKVILPMAFPAATPFAGFAGAGVEYALAKAMGVHSG